MKHTFLKARIIAELLLCMVLGMVLTGCINTGAGTERTQLPLISEAMNQNRTILSDAAGLYWDWVEIYNPNDKPFSLDSFSLTDDEKKPSKWVFPEGTVLAPKEYRVVFCSGKKEGQKGETHASFRLSSQGEPVILCDPDGKVVSRLDLPSLPQDISCAPNMESSGKLVFYMHPTPGQPNGEAGVSNLEAIPNEPAALRISEYTDYNDYAFFDQDGDCSGWMELENYGNKDINLRGIQLSDDPSNPDKWEFSQDLVLHPGEFQIVFLSGKDRVRDGEIHTSFRLGSQDQVLLITDRWMNVLDQVSIVHMTGNVSHGRVPDQPDNWKFFYHATPGTANKSPSFDTLAAASSVKNKGIWINEVSAVSGKEAQFEHDWIELYNGSQEEIQLQGYHLSDSDQIHDLYTFDDCILTPGEYLVLFADGKEATEESPYSLPFQISSAGERVILTEPDGTLCDVFDTGRQQNGISSGRPSDFQCERLFFSEPTPGAKNGTGFTGYTKLPEFSESQIYISEGTQIAIRGEGEIYYTLDGSIPTDQSTLYTAPISVNENVILRAACFLNGKICGGIRSHTYLVDTPHDISVICLSTDAENLFDEETGIYADGPNKGLEFPYVNANYWRDWERPVHFEFYEPNGAPGVHFDGGIRIFGQFSRALPQKSFSVHLRETYGISKIYYPFFQDNPVREYHDLLLRTSGQDWNASKLRDALAHRIVKGQMDIDIMDSRPAAVYINGQYWGLYNLRDKVNEQYLYTHQGTDPTDVDIIKGGSFALSGSMDAYEKLMDFIKSHDLSVQENFDYVASQVDIDEVMNYWITETFLANTDTGNIKIYKERGDKGKWRLILFDLDWCLYPTTYHWNMIQEMLHPEGHGVNRAFSTDMMRGLMQNRECREKFIEKYAHALNTTFSPERTLKILDEMASEIKTEMPRQMQRWEEPELSVWEKEIDFLQEALTERVTESKEDLQHAFGLTDERMAQLFPEPEG